MQPNYTAYNRAVKKVSANIGLSPEKVDKIYRAYCKLIVDKLSELPLMEELTEEEFKELQTSINLPSLGKIYVDWRRYLNIKQRLKYVQEGKKNKAARN